MGGPLQNQPNAVGAIPQVPQRASRPSRWRQPRGPLSLFFSSRFNISLNLFFNKIVYRVVKFETLMEFECWT